MSDPLRPPTARASSVILIDRLWPASAAIPRWLRIAVLAVAGIVLIAASARVTVPLPMVPMTLQTLAVLLVGAVYGAGLGAATVLLYLAAGALGLPVFAGAASGLVALQGPTAGFLAGFVAAAALAGRFGGGGGFWRLLAVMALGQAGIVLLGYLWLAFGFGLGAAKAWRVGVSPFLAGAAVKSFIGAAVLSPLHRLIKARR
jgi:biotin transport system substrate-specific component